MANGRVRTGCIIALYILLCLPTLAVAIAPVEDHSRDYYASLSGKPIPYSRTQKIRAQYDGHSVRVKSGDSVSKIAKRYGMNTQDLIRLNDLQKPYGLKVGQRLKLSTKRYHTVKRGEYLSKIAKAHRVDVAVLARLNSLQKPYRLEIGQKIRLPYNAVPASLDKTRTITYAAKKKAKKTRKPVTLASGGKKINVFLPEKPAYRTRRGGIQHASYSQEAVPTISKALYDGGNKKVGYQASRGKFMWPTKGKLLSRYGGKRGGVKNDGINIAAPEGSAVKAAASGSVVYVGNELKGYGNLVIVRHDGGWLSAYAHQSKVTVSKGQRVKKGQVIGRVGASGKVDRPQLHFAIRKGRKAVDPMKYLAG